METYEREKLLQLLSDENEFDAYKALYEAAAAALYELEDSYAEKRQDQADSLLAVWSRLLEHVCVRLGGEDHSIAYEAGRLCGIISVYERLFKREQDNLTIDAAIAELLRKGKPSSRQVLRILYESRQSREWVSRHILEEKSRQSQSSLSNIMKRLIRAQAVDFYKEGREVSYRLTAAGVRYYEKNLSPSMNDSVAMEMSSINEKISEMQDAIFELTNQISRQTSAIVEDIRGNLYIPDKTALQNAADHIDFGSGRFDELNWIVKFNPPVMNNVENAAI